MHKLRTHVYDRFRSRSVVVRDVTRAIRSMYSSGNLPLMNWKETPLAVRNSWFNAFRVSGWTTFYILF